MTEPTPCFIDSNIWLYALTISDDTTKNVQARDLISSQTTICVSTQVINEVCVNLLKKARFTEAEVRAIADDFFVQCTVLLLDQSILHQASKLREAHRLSFWDSLIVACALSSGAMILYSEDMQHGRRIDHLTIRNPFRPDESLP